MRDPMYLLGEGVKLLLAWRCWIVTILGVRIVGYGTIVEFSEDERGNCEDTASRRVYD